MAKKNDDSLSKTARSNVYRAVNSYRKQAYNGSGSFANQQSGSSVAPTRSSSSVNSGLSDPDREAVYSAVNALRQNAPQNTSDKNPYVNAPWAKEQRDRDIRNRAMQRAGNSFVLPAMRGQRAFNEVQNILQNNQEQKIRTAALQRLQDQLNSLPSAEISSGNRTNAATEALAKAGNARDALSYGLAKGLGYTSIVNAVGKATGQEQPSLRAFNEATEQAQRTAPNAFTAGNVAGNIALMSGVGSAAGAGVDALGLTGRAARLAANAATFGGTEAIHGLGDVARGNIDPGRYAKNIGTSALGGAVGGEASNLVGSHMANVLRDKGMMTPFMEFARQTASGTAFGAGNLAATQAVAYGTNDNEMKLNRRQAAEQLATTFGFSMINGAIRTLNATAGAKSALQSQVDQATAVYEQLTNGTFPEEEYIQRINTLMEFTDDLRKSINSQYLAGNQTAVNNMNDALDVIQESLRVKLGAVDAARAAGSVGNNILVDNLNPGVDTAMGVVPPENGPEPPVEDQLKALAVQTVDAKEAQRQALYDAGKNHEQNIQPLMDNATMLSEEEKLAAVRQGSQDAVNAEVESIRSENAVSNAIAKAKTGITKLVEKLKAGNVKNAKPVVISEHISDRLSADINNILGIDTTGWKSDFTLSAAKHIEKDHGSNGATDQSMANTSDYEMIPEVENNYTNIKKGIISHEHKNSDGTYAQTVELSMETEDGTSYVIEAVPDNKKRTLHVVSAFKNRAVSGDVQAPSRYVQDELTDSSNEEPYSAINNIPQLEENINVTTEQTGADSLRGRSIRVLSQRTGESAGGIQPAAGGAGETGNATAYADREAENLRIASEIEGTEAVRTAVPGQKVYLVEGDTTATTAAKNIAKSLGMKNVTLYASENDGIKVSKGDKFIVSRGSYDIVSDSTSVCVNNSRATSAQIMEHEAIERAIKRGDLNVDEVYNGLAADGNVLSEVIDDITNFYIKFSNEPADRASAMKELFCDVGGGINQFRDVEGWEDVADYIDDLTAELRPMLNESLGGALTAKPEAPQAETPDPIVTFSEQNNSKAVDYSIDQISQATGYQLVRNSEGVPYTLVDPATGKEVRPKDITPEKIRNTPQGRMIAASEKNGIIDAKTADAQRKFTADIMKMIVKYKDQATVWEISGSTAFSSFKANSDSQYGSTVDFGTICSKTQPIVDTMSNAMVEKGRGLKRDEVLKVYDAVAKTGLSVPCPVCYVFSRWVGVPSLLETMRRGQERFGENTTTEAVNAYIQRMESTYNGKEGINNAKVKAQGKVQKLQNDLLKARGNDKEIGRIAKEARSVEKELADLEIYNWVTQVRCKTDSKRNPIRDKNGMVSLDPKYKSVPNDVLLNLNRTGEFARDYPKQWLYRTTRGAGMGKAILPYSGAGLGDAVRGAGIAKPSQYAKGQNPFFNGDEKKAARDIANARKRMRAQNLIGGQRLQSTSDFRAEWGLDYIVDMMEMQNVGAKGQLYTKVIEAVDLLATAGNEVNLSIMGKGDGYHINSKGQPVLGVDDFSSVTGVDFRAALQYVNKYDNVQMILVGLNDTHTRLALADDRIGFVIPWHASGSSEDVLRQLMASNNEELKNGTDYTPVQDDHVIDYGDKELNAEKKSMRDLRKAIVMGKLKKGISEDQQALLDKNEWLQDLYNRYYVDENAEEYGVKLSGKQAEKIFPYEYWDKSLALKDADQNGLRFQEYCASLGLKPRFSGAIVDGKEIGNFANDPGYWKLLIDRSMYNLDGTYHEPQVIDVTKIKIDQIPMTVNSNLYRDDSKLKQATMDSLKALDEQPNDVTLTGDVGIGSVSNDEVEYSSELSIPERTYAPTFYSKLQREVEGFKGDKIGAASVESYLKGKGVKDEEIKWSGIRQFLEGKKSVNKQELMDYLKANELEIETVALGGLDSDDVDFYELRDAGFDENGTRWSEHSLKGGDNYREILFRMPMSNYSNSSMNAHWGQSGVLAHARVQDFESSNGGRVLFVEEIQSDWHNAGQKYGYYEETVFPDAELKYEDGRYRLYVNGKYSGQGMNRGAVADYGEDVAKEIMLSRYARAERGFSQKAPDAPFRNNYTDFVLKDLLRMAAEGDYDYLAWTTGKMQEERWSDEFAEGYRIEYDQDIPKFLKKYGKQWGAGLTDVELNTGSVDEDGNPRFDGGDILKTVPAIVVNDAMKESVLYAGQPMYSTALNIEGMTPEEIDAAYKEKFAKHRQELEERRRQRRDIRKARAELLKKANKAVKLSKNRPGYAAEAVQDLVKDLDLVAVGMREATKDKLREKYFEILKMRQEDPNYAALHSEKDMQKVERLFKKQIKDMDIDDVRDLITELSALIHYQETQNKLFKDFKNRTAAEAGRQWVKDLQELKPLNITSGVKQLGAKYLRNNLSPERAVRMISGYKRGSVASELVRNIEDGLTKQKEFEQKADQLFRPFLEDKANADFVKNASKQTIRIEDADGNSAMISPAMRVALYMHSKNTDNLKHIASGGVTIPDPRLYEQGKYYDAYDRGITLKLDPTEIENIIADMTPSETDYAGLLGTFFDTYSKDAINEASMTLDGIFKAVVDNYFPITSDKNFLAKAMDLTNDPTLEGWNNLKARQEGSSNPIMLEDVTKVLQRHITKTGQYYGLAVPLRDFQKVYGYTSSGYETSVQKAIGKTWDADTKKYLEQWITDLNTGGRQAEKGILDTMRGAYAGAVLTLNPSVALKQTTSYSMAGSILDFGSLMYGLGHRFTKADQEYMDSITPWGWARRQGQSTIELGDLAKQKQSLANKVPNWNQAMDVWTTNRLFLAAEKSVQKEYPNLKRGDEKYDKALAEKYNQVLWRTQPQYEAMFRPEYLRKTDIGSRTFGMFKTESMQMSGEMIDALGQWIADSARAKDGTDQSRREKSESARRFYKTFTSWLTSNMLFAIFGSAISIGVMHKAKQYRDDKGEVTLDSIAKQTAKQFGSSVFGEMFLLGQAYDVGQYLFDVIHAGSGNWYDIEAPGFSLLNDLINNAGNMIGTMMNEEANGEAKRKAIGKFVMSVSKFTPVGFAENLYNTLNSLNLYIQDGMQGTLGRYESGKGLLADTSPDKGQYARMALNAAQNGDFKTTERALKNTNKEQLAKALDSKISQRLYERFLANPENLASYVKAMGEGGVSITDVPDAGYPSFLKLRQALGDPERTQNWHHIVEQEQGPGEKNLGTFSSTKINNVNNIVSIPSGTKSPHSAISQYYGTVQDFTDGKTVREWLRDKSFEEQWEFGVEQLKQYGDIVPTDKGWVYIPDDEKIEKMMPLSEGTGEGPVDAAKYGDISMDAAATFQEKKIEAGEDGSTTKAEIQDIIISMINDGSLDISNAENLYSSQLKGKPKEQFDTYADKSDDIESYFDVVNAKSSGNQEGVVKYFKSSSLTVEEQMLLWELAAGYKPSSYEKAMK